ncbi:SDR family oxidoreductase [Amycolatopsis sp. NPDC054798]
MTENDEPRVALVTGSTRGLGLEIARSFCLRGFAVTLNYAHDESAADRAVRELSATGAEVRAVRADVGCAEGVHRMFDALGPRLDVLVHNAVRFHRMRATEARAPLIELDARVALGPLLHGAERLAALLPSGGRVVAISSRGARTVIPGYVSLGVAKAGLESLVRYLAVELAGRGVTVNAVAAGKLDEGEQSAEPEIDARVKARTPAGRLTTASDVAGVVNLLCRPEAAWIHGQTIVVDGGIGLLA